MSDTPRRPKKPETTLVVTASEDLGPGMVRLRFSSEDLGAFAASTQTDRYVKLVFETPQGPVLRTYTAVEPDLAAGTVTIDFVVHGTEGVAGPWARAAAPGDSIVARGPGGGYAPDLTADWHLFAGDESGLPAIRAALAALPAETIGYTLIEVPDAAHEQTLDAPAGVQVAWLHTDGTDVLLDAIKALPWPEGRVQAFVHGEAQTVMHGIRPYLFKERGLPRADVSISGYWRRGRTEETFRDWKKELAEAESGTA
ncbi:siderophore-interacting protein [Nocardioides insulae]|uniref:siderophore-interacting protein n=1 Tax=Nocardioides insulae TaxID=394734 RepID=UPI0004270542|nr:siderophore-interacting protein [Nocardioides insulae]